MPPPGGCSGATGGDARSAPVSSVRWDVRCRHHNVSSIQDALLQEWAFYDDFGMP